MKKGEKVIVSPYDKRKGKPEINLFPLDPNYPPYVLPQPNPLYLANSEDTEEVKEPDVSCISCFHRPNLHQLTLFKALYKITLVVTCLGPNEDAKEIKRFCKDLDIKFMHIELNGANKALLGTRKVKSLLKSKLTLLYEMLSKEKHRVLIHCAAGIHRTGVISYMIQRMFGYEPIDAENNLALIRMHTYRGVGSWRIEYAENLVKQLKLISLNVESTDNIDEEEKKEQEEKEDNDVQEDIEMIKKLSLSSDRSKTPDKKSGDADSKLKCELADSNLRKPPGWA